VHPVVHMHGTSLPNPDQLPLRGQRLATIMLVADGVGAVPVAVRRAAAVRPSRYPRPPCAVPLRRDLPGPGVRRGPAHGG
jgi:hypothetical protein